MRTLIFAGTFAIIVFVFGWIGVSVYRMIFEDCLEQHTEDQLSCYGGSGFYSCRPEKVMVCDKWGKEP